MSARGDALEIPDTTNTERETSRLAAASVAKRVSGFPVAAVRPNVLRAGTSRAPCWRIRSLDGGIQMRSD
jgi:hypothetical protein